MHKRSIRFIGIREFRQNLSRLLEEARKRNIHFVVMRHGKVAGHITPPTQKELMGEVLAEAKAQKPPKSRKEIEQFLREIRKLKISFPGHDGVAYQRYQRS
jgi:nicotinamidase-related amidase